MKTKAHTVARAHKDHKRADLLAVGGALVLAAVPACGMSSSPTGSTGGAQDGFTSAAQSGGASTVRVDPTLLQAVRLHQKQHPDVRMDIVGHDGDVAGSNRLQARANPVSRICGGWPDVVFPSHDDEANWAVRAGSPAPLDRDLIQSSMPAEWATGSHDPCTVNGGVCCLRNDVPQTVLRYDAKPMKHRRSSSPGCSPRPASVSAPVHGRTPSTGSPKTSPPEHQQRQHRSCDHCGIPPRPDRRSALHSPIGFFDAD